MKVAPDAGTAIQGLCTFLIVRDSGFFAFAKPRG